MCADVFSHRLLLVIGLAACLSVAVQIPGAAHAGSVTGFTTQVSPSSEANATEPSAAVDRADGMIYVAWQDGGGRHVARSDDGGRTFTQLMLPSTDIGDVDVRVGGPTPCATTVTPTPGTLGCLPGTHRVYVTSIEETPLPLQTHLDYSDDRGASWTENNVAAVNPSFIDRPWLAVYPSKVSANHDDVYIGYHDFTVSQVSVAASNDGGATFGPSIDVETSSPAAEVSSFCNTVPSDIEVDPETGEIYVQWITADLVQNATGCNITQNQNFHQVYVAHSPGIILNNNGLPVTVWDAHLVFDGPAATNTDKIFATLAVDDSGKPGVHGNVYSVFPDNLAGANNVDIWFSHSSDKAVTWSAPVKVNSDPGTHYFPWIAAGSTGRVDFIWYRTPDSVPSDASGSQWYTYFAQTTDGTDAVPKFNQTSASSGIVHVGGICTNGIFCSATGGNRDLADSISIAIDRGGSAALVYTDQENVLHGPTHIEYGCVTAQQTAIVGANQGLSCKGPAGP
jgi:hypothetical protein